MGEALIQRSNPNYKEDDYEVGDIAFTTASTMGSEWCLCNGEIVEEYLGTNQGNITYSQNFEKKYIISSLDGNSLALRNYKNGNNIIVSIEYDAGISSKFKVSIYGSKDALISTTTFTDTNINNHMDRICDGCWCANNTISLITYSEYNDLYYSVLLNLNTKAITVHAGFIADGVSEYLTDQYVSVNDMPFNSEYHNRGSVMVGLDNLVIFAHSNINMAVKANVSSTAVVSPVGLIIGTPGGSETKRILGSSITDSTMHDKYYHTLTITSYAQTSTMTALTILTTASDTNRIAYYAQPSIVFLDNETGTTRGITKLPMLTLSSLGSLQSSTVVPGLFVITTDFSGNSFTFSAVQPGNSSKVYIKTTGTSTTANTIVPSDYTTWSSIDPELSSGTKYNSCWIIPYKNKSYIVKYAVSGSNASFRVRDVNSLLSTSISIGTTNSNVLYPLSNDSYPRNFLPIRNNLSNRYGSSSYSFFPVYFQQCTNINRNYTYVFGGWHAPLISEEGYNAFYKYK